MFYKTIEIVLLLILSAFFSSSETAFTSLSVEQIETLAHKKGRRGCLVKNLLKKPEYLLITILTGNNLVNISMTAITTELTIELFGNTFIGIMTGLLTLTVLIFGEVIPKNIAIAHNEFIAAYSAPLIKGCMIALRPLILLINGVSSIFIRFIGRNKKDRISMDSILILMRYAEAKGLVADYENDMVHGVFRLAQQNISSIMTHRTKVFSLEAGSTAADSEKAIIKSGFSRIPIYENEPENITGVVYVKDLFKETKKGKGSIKLKDIATSPVFVSENKKVGEILFLMKKNKKKMAVVLDEYSGLSGIVTMENILEEVVGELYDENEDRLAEKIVKRSENEFFILGNTPISMINDRTGLNIPVERLSQTIGGYIVNVLGKIPHGNEQVEFPGGELVVYSASSRRVESVILRLKRSH